MLKEFVSELNNKIPNSKAEYIPMQEAGDDSILVQAVVISEVLGFFKNHPKFPFKVLQVISGVDYNEYFEICYMIATFDLHASHELIIKTRLTDRNEPTLNSVVDIYKSAEWQERECFDMLGIKFSNHPDLRRILCPDDWEGFPLRQDYMAAKFYNGMEINPDAKMNLEDREYIIKAVENKDELIKKALAKGL